MRERPGLLDFKSDSPRACPSVHLNLPEALGVHTKHKQNPEAPFPHVCVLRLGFTPGQEHSWFGSETPHPACPHLTRCLIKGRRDR